MEDFRNKVTAQTFFESVTTIQVENESKEPSITNELISFEVDIDDVTTKAKAFGDKNYPLSNMILYRYRLYDFSYSKEGV